MRLYCADDSPMHLDRIENTIRVACEDLVDPVIERFSDGKQLLERFEEQPADLVALDINMPELDGLSTLVRLKALGSSCKIVMVSAENKVVTKRLAKKRRFDEPEAKRFIMLNRVIERVSKGIYEQNKINSVLEACASLGLDPVDVARQYGAAAFLHKPFEPSEAAVNLRTILKQIAA